MSFDPFSDEMLEAVARAVVREKEEKMVRLAMQLEIINKKMDAKLKEIESTSDPEEEKRLNAEFDELERQANPLVAEIESIQQSLLTVDQQKMLFSLAFQKLDRLAGSTGGGSFSQKAPRSPGFSGGLSSAPPSRGRAFSEPAPEKKTSSGTADSGSVDTNSAAPAQPADPFQEKCTAAGNWAGLVCAGAAALFFQYESTEEIRLGWLFWGYLVLGFFVGGMAGAMLAPHLTSRHLSIPAAGRAAFLLSGALVTALSFFIHYF